MKSPFSQFLHIPYSTPTLAGALCILAIMTGTLVSACDSGGSNSSGSPEMLIPLQQGNEWLARTEGGDRIRAEVNSDSTVTVRGDLLLFEEESDGLLVTRSYDQNPVGDDFLLRYPIEAGTSYEHVDDEGGEISQVSVSRQSITVPAGSFECLLYTVETSDPADDYNYTQRVWIKPGLGPIRFSNDEDLMELESTNVNS